MRELQKSDAYSNARRCLCCWCYLQKLRRERFGGICTAALAAPPASLPSWRRLLRKRDSQAAEDGRRAEESGRGVRWYIVADHEQLDNEMDAFLALMAHDPEKDAFLTEAMRTQMKAAAREALCGGYLQLAFLEVDGEKACALTHYELQPPGGNAFSSDVAEIFTVRNGKIDSFDIYFDSTPFPK